jgi:hypothetical protein
MMAYAAAICGFFLALPSYAIYLLGTVSFVDAHPVVW